MKTGKIIISDDPTTAFHERRQPISSPTKISPASRAAAFRNLAVGRTVTSGTVRLLDGTLSHGSPRVIGWGGGLINGSKIHSRMRFDGGVGWFDVRRFQLSRVQ